MMMRGAMTSLILIVGIFCSAAWAQAHLVCRRGMVQCEGESPRRRCIATQWFCDGYDQCGNNWDEDPAVCATVECPQGSVPCEDGSPRGHCVFPRGFCDGWRHCENSWDEDPAVCARMPCEVGYYRCPDAPRRICLHYIHLCDGNNDCPDNSDEDPSVCRANGAYAARLCANAIFQQCLLPTGFFGTTGSFGMTEQVQLRQKLMNTDLQELCGPVLVAQECATGVLASEVCQMPDADHPRVIEMQQTITGVNITVNHVCRENVEVFDEHKECLLRLGRRSLAIVDSLNEQCPLQGAQEPCLPPELLDCAEGVVSQQCGQEIASQLRTLGTKVVTGLRCFEMNKKEKRMHRVFAAKKLMKKKTYSPLELMQKAFHTLF